MDNKNKNFFNGEKNKCYNNKVVKKLIKKSQEINLEL